MAYRKTYRKKATKKPMRYKAADVAFKAYKMAKGIKRLINVEKKIFEVDSAAISVGTTFTVTNLLNPAEGLTSITRTGLSIKPLNLQFRGILYNNGASIFNFFRIIIFRYRGEHGTAPVGADILATSNMDSIYNWPGRKKYHILWDHTYPFGSGTTDRQNIVMFNKRIRLTGHTVFTTDAGTAIEDGGLYVLYVATDNTNKAVVDYFSRVQFTDN